MKNLIAYFAKQKILVNIISIVVFVVGLYALTHIQRELFPNIAFDFIQVTTVYPGASAEEVERLVTSPIEQDLKEVDGVKKIMSISVQGQSLIYIQLDPDQTTSDEAKSDVQDVIDKMSDLPNEAEKPVVVSLESKLRPIVEVSLSGDVSESVLREKAKLVQDKLEKIRSVAKVNFNGLRDYEIRVEALPQKLKQYHVSLNDLIFALKNQNLSIPGGVIEAIGPHKKEMIVRTIGEYKSLEDIKKTVVRANELAESIRVGDVARVKRVFEKRKYYERTNGHPAIYLTVLKKEKGDAIQLVDDVKAVMEKMKPLLGDKIHVSYINDMSYFVRRRLKVLTNNLAIGLVLVVLILSLVLPSRIAFITAFGIPFSFLGTVLVFYYFGVSLNLVSMMGLIIVLGMLVDDAVVVTENSTRYLEEGMPSQEAAIRGAKEIWLPVFASVMTTVIAFAPLMSMSGIMGKFVVYLPLGVIVALLISLFECYFILPNHVAEWMQGHNPAEAPKNKLQSFLNYTQHFWDKKVTPVYVKTLKWLLERKYIFLSVVLGFLVLTGFLASRMRVVLFPSGMIETFMINIQMPTGTSLDQTREATLKLEKYIKQFDKSLVKDFVTTIGKHVSVNMNDPNIKRGSEYSQIRVYLTPVTDRDVTAKEIIEKLRKDIGHPPGIKKIVFSRPSGGPPVGRPISIAVLGKEYKDILPVVQVLKDKVKKIPGVSDVEDDYVLGKKELLVHIKKAEAAASGLTVASIGTAIRATFEGVVATSIKSLDEEEDIRVTLPLEDRSSEAALKSIQITNNRGYLVPLTQVASFSENQSLAAFNHEDNKRKISIFGDLDDTKLSAMEVEKKLKPLVRELLKKNPGIDIKFGGENEDTKESMKSLGRAFILAVFGIFMILILTFKSIYQPFLVLITVPLGLTATVWTFFLHGLPFSFLGMLGTVALGGVIVNNAIVFMDYVNALRAQGVERRKSILKAARVRIRPIFLTSITTVCGILPTAYGWGGLDEFVVPIALALGWGVFLGAIMTVFVFPLALSIVDDVALKIRKKKA